MTSASRRIGNGGGRTITAVLVMPGVPQARYTGLSRDPEGRR
ncbi:hypothetical protein BH23ACI1_BH23ACI1_30680 [soil metagenome]